VTRRYDTAQTLYRRLLASGVLSATATRELDERSAAIDPLRLKLELESAQRTLAARAVQPAVIHPLRSDPLLRQDVVQRDYQSSTKPVRRPAVA
jgi:hypothetical protein